MEDRRKGILDSAPVSIRAERTLGMSKRWGTAENSDPVRMNVVLKVFKQAEGDILRETYVTSETDIIAWTKEGREIFESFRTISIRDDGVDSYVALLMQVRRGLRSDLQRLVQTLVTGHN